MEALRLIWLSLSLFGTWFWLWYLINRVFAQMDRLKGRKDSLSCRLQREMWWTCVYVAAPIAQIEYWTNGIDWWDWVFTPINLWIWWDIYKRDDHDDRWKKRRKKVAAKVKVIAGKLVVVPLPHPA